VNTKTAFLKYGTAFSAAGLIAWLVTDLHELGKTADSAGQYRILADAFTIPGITLLMVWLLALVSMEGFFDGIAYALSCTVAFLFPVMGNRKTEAYRDYLERKSATRGSRKEIAFLWHAGGVFMVPAIVFLLLFYAAQQML